MTRKKKALLTIAIIILTVFIILPAVGFGILRWGILPPERLTPLVTQKANEFILGRLECERIELTYFETYPHLGIRITNGRVYEPNPLDSIGHIHESTDSLYVGETEALTLLSFKSAVLSFNPADYFVNKKITIGNISIESPHFHGYVDENGKANWDILITEADSVNESSSTPLPPIDIQQIKITDGHFTYDDDQQQMEADIEGFSLNLAGSLTQGGNNFDVEAGSTSFYFASPSYTLKNKLALSVKSRLLINHLLKSVAFEGAELKVNDLPFTMDGSVASLAQSNSIYIDLAMGLKASNLNDLLDFIPNDLLENRSEMITKGAIALDATIKGELGDSILPVVNLNCKISEGSFHMKGVEHGIDTLELDLDIHVDGALLDSSYVSLANLKLKGQNTSMDIQGKVTNLIKNPEVKALMQGRMDFTRLGRELFNPDTLLIEGVMNADLTASFTTDDILNSRYDKIEAKGVLNIDTLKVFSLPMEIDLFIANAHLNMGAIERENASRFLNAKDLLNATLTLDTMNIQYKDEISTNISKVDLQANTLPTIDTSAVIPVTGSLKFDRLHVKLPDSTWLTTGKTVFRGGIKSSESNKRTPMLGGTIAVDTIKYLIIPSRTRVIVAESNFNFQALPYRDARRQQARRDTTRTTNRQARNQQAGGGNRRDSAQIAARRDSLRRRIQSDSINSTNRMLRRWEARGSVKFKQIRAFTRNFPIPIRVGQADVKFSTDQITLKDTRMRLGKSDFMVSGEITRIRQAILRSGTLKGNFSVISDTIDCNQLMSAATRGMIFMEQRETAEALPEVNEQSVAELDTQISQMQDSLPGSETEVEDMLFIVPKQMDMTLQMKSKKIKFKELELENVEGEVVMRDQTVNLSDLTMHSNMGSGKLTMIYTARDKRGATAGFDLNMQKILVDRLIDLFPSMDTLVPMLRSFEGVVDCEMAATCRIDSTMSIILPSLHSTCFLNGRNLVLLDGETFAEISKTLMFKNKKRNQIDSLSVDLAIRDNKIEVYPFLLEMDRYRVAVGGTHQLDMSFNYHISVLKSPVPFKLGVDVTGNMDDFKFKIVKCRYKDTFKPAKSAELDSTRMNIRKEIRAAIQKQMIEDNPQLIVLLLLGKADKKDALPSL